MSQVKALTRRIDALSAEVARFTADIEELEPQLTDTRERADVVDAQIVAARGKGEGFFDTAWDTITSAAEWWWVALMAVQLGAVAIALGALAVDCSSAPSTYTFTASSSVIESGDRDLLGSSCAIRVVEIGGESGVESGGGRCTARIECEGRVVIDDAVACQLEEITTYDSEGEASTVDRLVVHSTGLDLHESTGRVDLGVDAPKSRIVMHTWSSEGDL
jgi:hypothetical protein